MYLSVTGREIKKKKLKNLIPGTIMNLLTKRISFVIFVPNSNSIRVHNYVHTKKRAFENIISTK